jgi:hypothetical protein
MVSHPPFTPRQRPTPHRCVDRSYITFAGNVGDRPVAEMLVLSS